MVEGPGQAELLFGDASGGGEGPEGFAVVGGGAALAGGAGDREERDVGDRAVGAEFEEGVVVAVGVDGVAVLDADDRGDLLGLVEVVRADVGDAEVADQALVAQVGEGAEAVGDRVGAGLLDDPEVDDVGLVQAELAQVFLDLGAEFGCRGRLVEVPGCVFARPYLGGDDEVVRVRRQRVPDQLVGVADWSLAYAEGCRAGSGRRRRCRCG